MTTRAVLCALLLSGLPLPGSAGEVGKVDTMRPEVARNDCRGGELETLQCDDPIDDDWCVYTGGRSAAASNCPEALAPGPPGVVMRFDNGKVVGLGPVCFFDVRQIYLERRDLPGSSRCDYLEICPREEVGCKNEAVETLAAKVLPKGTILHIGVEADGSTEVAVFEGSAEVVGQPVNGEPVGDPVLVEEGFRTYVKKGKSPTLPAPIDGDDIDLLRATFDDSPWLDGAIDFEPLKDIR